MICSKNFIAIPPGETIREQLENRGMTQKEFAQRMDMSEKHISNLINGKVELTIEMALRLEDVFGIPASFWSNLERIYREKLVRVEHELTLENDEEITKKFPYSKMAQLEWVPKALTIEEKTKALRNFFEVAKLNILDDLSIPGIAYRTNGENSTSDYALAAWSQKAKIEARKIETDSINIKKLENSVEAIRQMTILKPDVFCGRLRLLLASCGIAIVFLPHIGGSFLHGASFVDNKHIVLGLTVRGKDADKFWFSLFHEVYHIIEGHINTQGRTSVEEEKAADIFARDILIPPNKFVDFINANRFYKNDILNFAKEIGVDPGIVVGRLQKENYIKYSYFNDLKTHYAIL